MRFFALGTTTKPFKTHSAWLPGSGLVQIAVSSMLRLDCPNSTQLYLRSTVDTALQIFRQLGERPTPAPLRTKSSKAPSCRTKHDRGRGGRPTHETPLLPNHFTRTAIPVALFSLLIKDMPCRAITCPTARGAGCTRMEKLEVVVTPVGFICMTPLPLLCVV
jgi:hypothetical protein